MNINVCLIFFIINSIFLILLVVLLSSDFTRIRSICCMKIFEFLFSIDLHDYGSGNPKDKFL